jgi:hypothetical protein
MEVFAPQDGIYNPVEPVGFEGTPGETWNRSRSNGGSETVRARRYLEAPLAVDDGSILYQYEAVDASRDMFRASERIDAEGHILARKATYPKGVRMTLPVAPGQNMEINVREIETRRNADGSYDSRIYPVDRNEPDGKSKGFFKATTNANGESSMPSWHLDSK